MALGVTEVIPFSAFLDRRKIEPPTQNLGNDIQGLTCCGIAGEREMGQFFLVSPAEGRKLGKFFFVTLGREKKETFAGEEKELEGAGNWLPGSPDLVIMLRGEGWRGSLCSS